MLEDISRGNLYSITYYHETSPTKRRFTLHAHSHYELMLFLAGDMTCMIEGTAYKPEPWDLLLFDIAETHRVVLHSDTPYERIIIQLDQKLFSNIPLPDNFFAPFTNRQPGENNLIHAAAFKDDLWKQCMRRFMEYPTRDKTDDIFLLLTLLNEIRHAYPHKPQARAKKPLSLQLILYINDHLTEDLSSECIARHFFISRSLLHKTFREVTGTSLHSYINVKRLIMAQSLLKQGKKPTETYEICGFKEYTTFFRAYKTMFGKSPKEDSIQEVASQK